LFRWYVARVKNLMLVRVLDALARQGYATMNPEIRERYVAPKSRKLVNRMSPLFPGFVFIGFDADEKSWRPINNTRGVRGLLTFVDGTPSPLPHREAEMLQRQCAQGPASDAALLLKEFQTGKPVRMLDGPFAGHVGTCDRLGDKSIMILLEVMGRATPVTASYSSVQAA